MRFRLDVPPAQSHLTRVLWVAPGSLTSAIEAVQRRWRGARSISNLAEVRGPWGALLWDAEKAEYSLATDSIGVHPVFWTQTSSGEVVAGSWLAKVVDEPDVSEDLDYEAILIQALPFGTGDEVSYRTNFAAVQRLPWGCVRTFPARGSGKYARYWDPSAVDVVDITVAEASGRLRQVVEQAVERSLDDDLPTGAHVSGGLDCSAVALKAQELLTSRGSSLVAGYSWSPPPATFGYVENDERPRVLAVAEAAGIPIRWVDADEVGDWYFGRDLQRYPHNTLRWERSVLPQAHADGVAVLLSGWGGDELASFNGRNAVADLVRKGHLGQAWRMAGANPLQGRGWARLAGGKVFLDATRHALPWHRSPRRVREAVARAAAAVREESPMAADLLTASWERQRQLRTVHDTQLELLTHGHLQARAMAWYQVGRLFNIWYRYPLLDHDVVCTALSLPPRAFRSAEWSRVAFRQAVAPWTPTSVVWHRPKFEPAMLHPNSPRRASRPDRPALTDERVVEVLALASQVSTIVLGTR